MPCAGPSKSSTKRPARSGSRARVPRHAVGTSLSVSGRYEIDYRDPGRYGAQAGDAGLLVRVSSEPHQ